MTKNTTRCVQGRQVLKKLGILLCSRSSFEDSITMLVVCYFLYPAGLNTIVNALNSFVLHLPAEKLRKRITELEVLTRKQYSYIKWLERMPAAEGTG